MDIKGLTKLDLHCHLDGSMTLATIRELTGNQGITEDQLKARERCNDLAEYLEKFEIPLSCLQDEKGLTLAAYRLVEEAHKENIKYLEVRFAPMLSVNGGLNCRQVLESVWDGLQAGESDFEVCSNMIVCAMRHHDPELNLKMLAASREMLGAGVAALDLAGDEAAFANSGFRDLFHQARAWDMPFTIHAGECGSVANVREAMELGARRIGHGIALREDEELIREYAARGIGIEMCPTSNLQTRAIEHWEDYPLMDFIRKGLKVSINTDNRTVSDTTMSQELQMVFESCSEDEGVIYKVLRNAVDTAFASDDIKHMLVNQL